MMMVLFLLTYAIKVIDSHVIFQPHASYHAIQHTAGYDTELYRVRVQRHEKALGETITTQIMAFI